MSGTGTTKRMTLGLVVLVAVVCAFVILRPDLWRYYTDGYKIRQPKGEAVVRQVLWEEPELMATHVNSKPDNYEPTISADGRTLIFSRGRATQNADLYVARWDGTSWEEPTPIAALNTPEDELGPELSRDGDSLYFYSNREGGLGGYDIWVSQRGAEGWGVPVNLGDNVNSAYNDYDPALSPTGRCLYLSSNRPKGEISEKERAAWGATLRESRNLSDYDIFSSDVVDVEEIVDGVTHQRRKFGAAVRVETLNSLADEGQVSLTPRGDFLYFSSDRAGGEGGFDIYRSRLFDDELLEPEHIGSPVNSELDDMDPTLWMEGYGLVFSSNRERQEDGEHRFRIYHSLSREVMSRTDLSGFDWILEFLRLNKWWLLALLLALLALIALLRLLLNKGFRRSLSLIQRCILGSLLLHLLLALLLSLWLVSEAVYQAVTESSMELVISEGALSRERLALDIREQVTELPSSSADFAGQEPVERLPLPEIAPTLEQIEPELSEVSPTEFVTDVESANAPEPRQQDLQRFEFTPQLPALALTRSLFQLETPSSVAPEPEQEEAPLEPDLQFKQAEPLPEVERSVELPRTPSLENLPVEAIGRPERDITPSESPIPEVDPIQPPELASRIEPFDPVILVEGMSMEYRYVEAPTAVALEVELFVSATPQGLSKASAISEEANRPQTTGSPLVPELEMQEPEQIVEPVVPSLAPPTTNEAPAVVPSAVSMPEMVISETISLGQVMQMEDRAALAPAPASSTPQLEEADSQLAVGKVAPSEMETTQPQATSSNVNPASLRLASSPMVEVAQPAATAPKIRKVPPPIQATYQMEPMELLDKSLQGDIPRMEDRDVALPNETPESIPDVEIDSGLNIAKASSVRPERNELSSQDHPIEAVPLDVISSVNLDDSKIAKAEPVESQLTQAVRPVQLLPSMELLQLNVAGGLKMEDRNVTSQDLLDQTEDRDREDSQLGVVRVSTRPPRHIDPLKTEQELSPMTLKMLPASVEEVQPQDPELLKIEISEPVQAIELAPVIDPINPTNLVALVQMETRRTPLPEPVIRELLPELKDSSDTSTKMSSDRMSKSDRNARPLAIPVSLGPIRLLLDTPAQDISAPPMGAKLIRFDRDVEPRIPPLDLASTPLMEAPEALSRPYLLRDPETRGRLIEALGGSDETEAAIVRALEWLTRNQAEDGSWEVGQFGGRRGHRTAGTGLALLCYLGWGAKHNEPGPYQEPVFRALQFLLDSMDGDGRLWRRGDRGMYDQGIASIALAEAYGVSQDPVLKEPVERALYFILKSSRRGSEWRYNPGDPGDTSVYGWQVMALKSGLLAGVDLPDGVLEKAGTWLDQVGGGDHGGIYGYTSKRYHGPGMVAEGMFCQQLLGVPRSDPRMIESAAHLGERLPSRQSVDFYYFYYGCLALYQHQGPIWEAWNERMRELLLSMQTLDGDDAGSWRARGARPNDYGRLVSTAMATLSLEVYYRYLPLYGLDRN